MKNIFSLLALCLLTIGASAQYQAEIALDFNTGDFTNANPLYLASEWKSTNAPIVTLLSPYGNYLTGSNLGYEATTNDEMAYRATEMGVPYRVSVEEGYRIVGYRIKAYTLDDATNIVFLQSNTEFNFGIDESEEGVDLDGVQNFEFSLIGENAWLHARIVVVVESDHIAPVNYTIKGDDGNIILQQTLVSEVGTVISELPASLQKKYTTYSYSAPITVSADRDNNFEAVASFHLPFTTGDEKLWFINLGGFDYLLYARDETSFSVKDGLLLADSLNLDFQWYLEGNPYTGIGLRNAATDYYASGYVAAGSNYTATYSELSPEFAGWDIEPVEDAEGATGFRLFRNGTDYMCVYRYNFYVSNQEYMYQKLQGLITLTEVPNYQPVQVDYVVVDTDGNELLHQSEFKLSGDRVSDIPEEMKRGFCTYELSEPFKVARGQQNQLTAVVTYHLPFQTLEDNGRAWYCLTVADTAVIGGRESEDNDLEVYAFSEKDGLTYEEYKEEPICWWAFSGSPYAGFTLKNADANAYLAATESNYAYVSPEPSRWYIGEGEDGGLTFTLAGTESHLYLVEGVSQIYNWAYSFFITSFQFAKVDEEKVGITPTAVTPAKAAGIYDLQGRKVQGAKAGLYIVDGKKRLIK